MEFFSGVIFLDLLILCIILLLPIPTTPYLLFLFSTRSIFEASFLYFFASNLVCLLLYLIGNYSSSRMSNISEKFTDIHLSPFLTKLRHYYLKTQKYSAEKLRNFSIKEVLIARLVVHPILINIGVGLAKGKLMSIFMPNIIYAILDILFYWALIGSGKALVNYFFPEKNIEELLSFEYVYIISLAIIILFYLFLAFRKWRTSLE